MGNTYEYNKTYYWKNKQALINRARVYQKNRYKKNVAYKLKMICVGRIRLALKQQDAARYYKYSDLIGCSWKDLQKYLESKFKPGMKWKHHTYQKRRRFRAFHIDHIKPCTAFDLNNAEEQKKCFHYTNLQPLFVDEHYTKTFGYIWELETKVRRMEKQIAQYKKVIKEGHLVRNPNRKAFKYKLIILFKH